MYIYDVELFTSSFNLTTIILVCSSSSFVSANDSVFSSLKKNYSLIFKY